MTVGTETVTPGQRLDTELRVARLPTGSWLSLPVSVIAGRRPGPRLWLSAAIHGDELCGIEIVRQVLEPITPDALCGAIVAVPVVNVFGFTTGSRYLPDRRDLNRSFPGSPRGSLAARLAHLFMRDVVRDGSYGIDLHTGAEGRTNLPQVRGDLDDPEVVALATAFAAPVSIHARTRDGSLREAATRAGATVLLYEGGEASRYDHEPIAAGVDGVRRVLAHLGMLDDGDATPPHSHTSRNTTWVRARRSGLLDLDVGLGQRVTEQQQLGVIRDAGGTLEATVRASAGGIVIGTATSPLVHQGDAVVHIASVDCPAGDCDQRSAPSIGRPVNPPGP